MIKIEYLNKNFNLYDFEIKLRYNIIVAVVSNAFGRYYSECYGNTGKFTSSRLFNHHMQPIGKCKNDNKLDYVSLYNEHLFKTKY